MILNICKTDERAEEQMLKKWYAKLLVLLAVVCAVAAAHPAAQAEAIPEETAQTQVESIPEEMAQEQNEDDAVVQGTEVVASGTCGDNLTWSLDSAGTLSISGSGAMWDYYGGRVAPWRDNLYRNTIKLLTLPDGLTSIGWDAFYNCTNLTSVTFPASLTSIGSFAFKGCSKLTSVTFPDGLTSIGEQAFCGCAELTSVTFPEGLTSIHWGAFYGCGLTGDLTFPTSLTSIGGCAFYKCGGFKGCTLTLPEGLECVERETFYLCGFSKISVPASVAEIEPYGLYCGTNGGADIYFSGSSPIVTTAYNKDPSFSPDSTLYFDLEKTGWVDSSCYDSSTGKWCGYKASAVNEGLLAYGTCGTSQSETNLLWKLYRDGRLNISGSGAMADYSAEAPAPWTGYADSIYTVTVEPGVTAIGAYAFYNCGSLTAIALPDSLASIGEGAFRSCSGLTSVTLPDGLTSIGSSAFQGCTSLTSVSLPDGLTSIGNSAFEDCTSLTSVSLPGGSTSIGDSVFNGCTGPLSITFRGDLTSIGDSMFSGCSGLTRITFLGDLTSIGKSAFRGCTGLTSVTLPDGLTSISEYAFFGCTGLTSITLPRGLTLLRPSAFAETGITAFASESDKYTVDESGAVYDTSGYLMAYPAGSPQTVYTIQDGTKELCEYAFYGAAHLDTVIVPDSVSIIDSYAFRGMAELQSVYFIGNKPTVNNWAFETDTNHRLKIYHEADTAGWSETWWPSQYFELIVWNPHQATGVELDEEKLTLALGASQKLTAKVLALAAPENTAVTWASADVDAAAVFADGTVLGKKAGTTTVTATTADGGFTASCAVTVEPAPDGVMPVRLDSVCARPGNTVQVRLMLDKNPGFANLSLVIGYDTDVMTLTKVENRVSGTDTSYTASQKITVNPYMMTWNNGTSNCTATGTLATLTFQIKDSAAYGVYPISVSFYKGIQGTYKDGVNVNYDQSRNALPLVYVGSSAEIRSYIPGDINGDGRVDSRDVLNLLRHLSSWEGITVVKEALDVNGDGESDFRDATALLQYVAGWDVVLH